MTAAPPDASSLWQAFERTVRADPGAPALSAPGVTLTREELAAQASGLGDAMRRAGVREHGVVMLMLPNSVAFVAAFLAVARLPALAALVSARFKDSELRAICAGIRPDHIVVAPEHAAEVAGHLDVASEHDLALPGGGQGLRLLSLRGPAAPSVLDARSRFGLGEPASYPALIKFSSGSTTGAPKAVLWTAANVRAAARNVVETLQLDASDAVLAPVPLSHSYGFDLGLLPLVFAGTRLAIRDRLAWKTILTELVDERISVFLGVPAMYHVLNRTRLDRTPDLSSVRYLLSCTAPLPVDVLQAFARRFDAWICQHYGSSETGGISLHMPADLPRRPGSVGRSMRGVRVSIVDARGEPLPAGRRGEVVVEGDATAWGYVHGDTLHDENGFQDGRYRTGDVGFLDADGLLHLDGSRDGVAHVGGWKVSLAEVAHVLESHPSVLESAVTVLVNPRGRKRVVAAVATRGAAEEAALVAFCQARLADYKVPRRVHVLGELPRTASGEVAWSAEHLPA